MAGMVGAAVRQIARRGSGRMAGDDPVPELQGHHWAIWAELMRDGGARLGYPSRTNFYTPARRQDDGKSSDRTHYTDADVALAERIPVALRLAPELDRIALVEFYGAYPGAPRERRRRLAILRRKLNRGDREVYRIVGAAQRFVAGVIQGWTLPRD